MKPSSKHSPKLQADSVPALTPRERKWNEIRSIAFEQGVIAPSILSADFSRLGEEIRDVEKAGARWLHVDDMDGHFVPNLTLGPPIVESIRPRTDSLIDCHLMVTRPQDWIEPFVEAGADCVTIHAEVTPHLHRLIGKIKECGIQAGVSINPGTPVSMIEDVLSMVDLVLVMSVNPGFGGQKFIPAALEKIQRLAEIRRGRDFVIQVDGGVQPATATLIREAGADCFVAGSALFEAKNRSVAFRSIEKAIENGN